MAVLGRVAPDPSAASRRRYLARQPSAAGYADFKDFRLYRMSVERAHLVAGFGRIRWLDRDALLVPPAPALAESEAGIRELATAGAQLVRLVGEARRAP